jgi:Rrf2 family protein
MRTDSRLSRILHVLLHMARHDGPLTSEQIAKMLDTNPVVVRRTMAGLRNAGYVKSEVGPKGGWSIACDLTQTTLLDVHHAVGGPHIVVIGVDNENPQCAVEKVVNSALKESIQKAERALLAALGEVRLSDLATQFDTLCIESGWKS